MPGVGMATSVMGLEPYRLLKAYAVFVTICIVICQANASPFIPSADEDVILEGPNNMWVKTYNYSSGSDTMDICRTDAGYLIGGSTWDPDGILLHVDTDGMVLFQRQLGGDSYDSVESVVQCANGDFAMVGRTGSYSNDSSGRGNLWLARLASNGSVLWDNWYLGLYWGRSMVEYQDGSFIIAAAAPHLIRIHSNGSLMWSKSYGDWDTSHAGSVVECSNGGFAFTGYIGTEATGYHAWLVRTDSNGAMLWNQTYGDAFLNIGHSLIQCSDGGYAIAGESGAWYYFPRSPWLVRTDENGTRLWSRTYSTGYAQSVVECSDGGFGIAGIAADSEVYSTWDALFVRTDEEGRELWRSTCSESYEDRALSLILIDDDGFAVAGWAQQGESRVAFLWRLSDEYVSPLATAIPILALSSGIIIAAVIIWKLKRASR